MLLAHSFNIEPKRFDNTRKTINIDPAWTQIAITLAQYIVTYMGIHLADFYCLLGYCVQEIDTKQQWKTFKCTQFACTLL